MGLCSGSALAGPPSHSPFPALDIEGLSHACGTAVDSQGDVYVSSAGESKVKVYSPAHTELASISDVNEPCGLAVDSVGSLYVSEKATGKVVRYKPDAYPLTATPTYSGPVLFDPSGSAKGISVDPYDNRLYVAEGSRITSYQFDGSTGQDEVQEALISSNVSGGSFTLSFEGQTSAPIAVSPAESKPADAEVQSALEGLSTIGAENVLVEQGERGARSYRVTFTGALASKDAPAITASSGGLIGGEVFMTTLFQGSSFSGHIGEGELSDATGVAAYTYGNQRESEAIEAPTHYVFATDSGSDRLKSFSGPTVIALKARLTLDGKAVPDSEACPDCSGGFEFNDAAAAVNWANGHVLVYDDGHNVVDEFEADGRFLDQVASPSFADAGPSGVAVLPERSERQQLTVFASGGTYTLGYEGSQSGPVPFNAGPEEVRAALEAMPTIGTGNVVVKIKKSGQVRTYGIRLSGELANRNIAPITVADAGLSGEHFAAAKTQLEGYGPGRLYVSAGSGSGAKLLAFGPLAAPSRAPLDSLSRALAGARAVAVDSHGGVYVAAGPSIHVFTADGEELLRTEGAVKAPLIADPNTPIFDLAVDSSGKVYVIDGGGPVVTYYTPSSYPPTATTTYSRHEPLGGTGQAESIAVNPSNDHLLAAGSEHIVELDSAADESTFLRNFASGISLNSHLTSIGVYGANEDVYVAENNNSGRISVINAAGTEILARITGAGDPNGPLGPNPKLAIDQSDGHVLTFQGTDGEGQELDAAGGLVAEFGQFSTEVSQPFDIAIDNSGGPSNGNVYIAFDDQNNATPDLSAFGPLAYGESPSAVTGVASGLGGGEATLHGTVNPNGFALTDCHFEYLPESQYVSNGETFAGAESAACEESLAAIGEGTKPAPVHADLGPLTEPQGRYRFRLTAANKFGSSQGKVGVLGPPELETEPALPILYTEATLRAKLDPSGLATTYRFEYGKAAGEYDRSTPVETLAPGAGPSEVEVPVTDLDEGTVYHFRLVAKNEDAPLSGPDQVLTTLARRPAESCPNAAYRSGLGAVLPDCRAYELTTPAETNGLSPEAASSNNSGGVFNDWLTPSSGESESAGQSLSYFTQGTLPGFEGNGRIDGYTAERTPGPHPEAGWQSTLFGPSFRQSGPGTLHVPSQQGVSADQHYSFWRIEPSVVLEGTLAEGLYLRTPAGFEVAGRGSLGADLDAESDYISPGGEHVIFSSAARLEPQAPEGTMVVYDRAAEAGSAQVVSLKPNGEPFGPGQSADYIAASEDGATVAFEVGGALFASHSGHSAEVAGAPNAFAGLSADGTRVFYAAGAGNAPAPLFACDIAEGSCAGPEASHGADQIAPAGIYVGVSADGSHAFFSSKEALTPSQEQNENHEHAEAGHDNLYGWDAESATLTFIAQFAPADFESFAGNVHMDLGAWSASISTGPLLGRGNAPTRSSESGGVFLFQSHARLTEYDNHGKGEIYRFEPSAEAGQRLLCVSCDPSGASPSGDALLETTPSEAASPPVDAASVIPNLSANGEEVFFQSPDRLLPEDANSAQDVYEWKAPGAPGCSHPGGCLALISSGQGENPNYLYAMSASGSDVFFWTQEKLVGQDTPGSPSLYDARVGGGIPEPAAPAPCQGDACQGNGSEPPVLPGPASTGSGEGNESASSSCAKGKHRVKGRCVTAKKHHKRKRHPNRGGRR